MIPSESISIPRLLVVDDERQIHMSLKLRLAEGYELTSCSEPQIALARIKNARFDLCIVDLHMPGMDGLTFIEAAREIDPGLGFVILSGNGTEENLRRTIPLQVYDFIYKPLPDRTSLEQQLPDWVQRTQQRRREIELLTGSGALARELHAIQIERDIEFTASESARDALLKSANLLTTINALLLSAAQQLESRAKSEPGIAAINRSVQEARRATETATAITEGFFNSAYANRDTSPAHLGSCLASAASICSRWAQIEERRKHLDLSCDEPDAVVWGISGIELLLLLIPALGAALEVAESGTTVQVRAEGLRRVDVAHKHSRTDGFIWVNRKHALHSHAGVMLSLRTSSAAFEQTVIKQWLEGDQASRVQSPARGLVHGLKKCKGMLGFAVLPANERFELVIALPT
jgi:CheY-like chemotaxis protein